MVFHQEGDHVLLWCQGNVQALSVSDSDDEVKKPRLRKGRVLQVRRTVELILYYMTLKKSMDLNIQRSSTVYGQKCWIQGLTGNVHVFEIDCHLMSMCHTHMSHSCYQRLQSWANKDLYCQFLTQNLARFIIIDFIELYIQLTSHLKLQENLCL